jgi:hypothetical protein
MPGDAMLILSGLVLAWAMNSGIVLAGNDRCTTTTLDVRMMPATGAMSPIKLKLSLSYKVALLALKVPAMSSV